MISTRMIVSRVSARVASAEVCSCVCRAKASAFKRIAGATILAFHFHTNDTESKVI